MSKTFYFDSLLKQIKELPVWVKQAFYVEMKDHLKQKAPYESIEAISKHNLVQLYVPKITQAAIKSLTEDVNAGPAVIELSNEMKTFLELAREKMRIIDICQVNSWTLSKVCQVIVDCIEKGLIEPIYSDYLSSTIYFLANKIRIGEYLVRTGKITVDQLDMALYSQKYTEENFGDRVFLAQILLNLRYINPDDYENIIFLKEYGNELYATSFNENISEMSDDVSNLKKEILNLQCERLKLRENLSQFSDDAQTIAQLLNKIDTLKVSVDKIQSENARFKNELDVYVDELMATTQENLELKQKLDKK
jgi:hypothetical protein